MRYEDIFTSGSTITEPYQTGDSLVCTFQTGDSIYSIDSQTGEKNGVANQLGELTTSFRYQGTVYVGTNSGNAYAIDANTGNKQWSYTEPANRIFVYPPYLNDNIPIFSSNTLYIVDRRTGTEQWQWANTNGGSWFPDNDTVYIGDNNLYAVDATTGAEQWTYEEPLGPIGQIEVVNGTVYVEDDVHVLYAVNATSGTEEWRYDVSNDFLIDGFDEESGILYFVTLPDDSQHDVYAIDMADGSELWAADGSGQAQLRGIVNGASYLTIDGMVLAVDGKTGNIQWTYSKPSADVIFGEDHITNGTVYMDDNSNVYAVDAETGNERWVYTGLSDSGSSYIREVTNETVYVEENVDNSENAYAVDAESGNEQWSVTGSSDASIGTVINGFAYVSLDEIVFKIAPDQDPSWSYTASNEPSAVDVVDGTVYIRDNGTDSDSYLYAVNAETGNEEWNYGILSEFINNVNIKPIITNEGISVNSNGDIIQTGGQATIDISALQVNEIEIEGLWTDWDSLVNKNLDGGTANNNIANDGIFRIEWGSTQGEVTPSIVIAPPQDTYIGGEYVVTVTGTDGTNSDTDEAIIEIA
ncbi:outer membrane protein assembly factor BamB family protein [Halapricum salinum]|uniref:Pyrrolo-quinoline quinone repeat domain-containing protein n=1 Tax=Halapricum salinum TaxID=1457250 RepID=A0A4D6HC27_9EURY|nr:PQQ-binding-like beta-propeller repeat protein [Halapricum salinum]QCC50267.1 hypothetical protein DV733_03020 [Halapricum salinum]